MNFIVNFFKKLKIISRKNQVQDLIIINSAEDFQVILKRERARADRSNKKFSLVVFEFGSLDVDSSFAQFLIKFLSSRVRLSDVVGWFDDNRIGILLPDTSPEGAWKLAEEIKKKIALTISSPVCTVYMYPSPVWPEEIG